jgi:hypothetical protein
MEKKYFWMQMSCLTVAVFILFGFTEQNAVKFSGHWKINLMASYFGDLESNSAAPTSIDVEQNDIRIKIERTFAGKSSSSETLLFNGDKTIQNIDTSSTRKSVKQASLKWSDDGENLILLSEYNVNDNVHGQWQYHRTERWRLSSKNNVLTIDRVTVLPDHTDSVRAVYNKRLD